MNGGMEGGWAPEEETPSGGLSSATRRRSILASRRTLQVHHPGKVLSMSE